VKTGGAWRSSLSRRPWARRLPRLLHLGLFCVLHLGQEIPHLVLGVLILVDPRIDLLVRLGIFRHAEAIQARRTPKVLGQGRQSAIPAVHDSEEVDVVAFSEDKEGDLRILRQMIPEIIMGRLHEFGHFAKRT